MKGLVLYPGGEYKLEEVEEPKIGDNVYSPGDVILQVKYCGVW